MFGSRSLSQMADGLDATPRDLLLSRGGPVARLDQVAKAAALLRGVVMSGAVPASDGSEALLASMVSMVSEQSPSSQLASLPIRDARLLLALSGINTTGEQLQVTVNPLAALPHLPLLFLPC